MEIPPYPQDDVPSPQKNIPKLKIDNNLLNIPVESPPRFTLTPSTASPPVRKRFFSFSNTSLPGSPNASSLSNSPRTCKSIKVGLALSRFSRLTANNFGDDNESSMRASMSFNFASPNEEPEEKVRRILTSPKRSQDDALFIYKQIQHFDFFIKFKENNTDLYEIDSLLHICKHLGFEKFRRGQTVFEEDADSNGKMYLMFSGEVSIIVKNPDFVTKQNLVNHNIEKPATEDSSLESDSSSDSDRSGEADLLPPQIEPISNDFISNAFSDIFRRDKQGKEENRYSGIRFSMMSTNIDDPPKSSKNTKLWKKFLTVTKLTNSVKPKSIVVDPQINLLKESEHKNSLRSVANEVRRRASRMIPVKGDSMRNTSIVINGGLAVENSVKDERDQLLRITVNKEAARSSFRSTINAAIKLSRKNSDNIVNPAPSSPNRISFQRAGFSDPKEISASKYGTTIMKLIKGNFFGEKALYSQKKRSATVVTNVDCEFLTISEELFSYIKARFEKTNTKKLNFLLDTFPDMERIKNRTILENLLYLLEEKTFDRHANLTAEGAKGKHFYILFEGTCNVYKKFPDDDPEIAKLRKYGDQEGSNKKDGLLVCQIFPGAFIGEEVIFNGLNQYEFTVKATSASVIAMAIDRAHFSVRFPGHVYKALKTMHRLKADHYMKIGLERAKLKSDIVHLARPIRKKKVGLRPGEITSNDYIRSLNSSRNFTANDDSDKIAKGQFTNRAIVLSKFTHLAPQSVRQREDSLKEIHDAKATDPNNHEKLVIVQYPNKKNGPGLSKTKFDFGSEPETLFKDDKDPISSRNNFTHKHVSTKNLNLVQLPKDQPGPLTSIRASSAEYDILGAQLLHRVKKSRQKSKKFPYDTTFMPMTTRETKVESNYLESVVETTSPSLERLHSEPFIPYSEQTLRNETQFDLTKRGAFVTSYLQEFDQPPIPKHNSPIVSTRELLARKKEEAISLPGLGTGKKNSAKILSSKVIKKSVPEIKSWGKETDPFARGMLTEKFSQSRSKAQSNNVLVTMSDFRITTKGISREYVSPRKVSLEAGFLSGIEPNRISKEGSMSARGGKFTNC